MTDTGTAAHTGPGLFARAIGTIVSPADTFRAVIARPRPVGILFLVCLVFGLATGGPQLTEAGKRASLEMQVQQIERFTGRPVTPDQYVQMEQRVAYGAYATMAGVFVFIPFMTVLFSALYWAFFNIVLGGSAGFGQVVTVNAHSQVITALGALLGAPIQILQGTFSQAGPFNLGALAPMVDPASGLALFLGTVTFFGLWQTVVGGIGLGVLYKRAPTGIIIGLLAIYLGTTALFTVGLSSVMGGN
jgi:hypothetical protein